MITITEQLNEEEIVFLRKKAEKDWHHFYRTLKVLMVICFVIPFAFAWKKALAGDEMAFSIQNYFMWVAYLLALSGICAYLSYHYFLGKIMKDIHKKSKTTEICRITQKTYMPQNDTYYFYLDSPTKLSIEVTAKDYNFFNEGDEISIEYATFSKHYFGYF